MHIDADGIYSVFARATQESEGWRCEALAVKRGVDLTTGTQTLEVTETRTGHRGRGTSVDAAMRELARVVVGHLRTSDQIDKVARVHVSVVPPLALTVRVADLVSDDTA